MRRAFVVSLAAAVVAVSLVAPAEAKKKKPRKPPAPVPVQVDATYFLRRDGDCAEAGSTFLSLVDAPDVDELSCGNSWYGIVANAEPAPAITYATREADGVPVTLDATKEITGMIGVKSQSIPTVVAGSLPVRWGIGKTTLNIDLVGTTADGEKKVAATTVEYDVTPGDSAQMYEVEFTMKPDAALDKTVFTSLSLSLHNSGTSHNHGFYTTDNPASYFKIGTWQ